MSNKQLPGKKIDWEKAYERLKKAAAAGNPKAKIELAKFENALATHYASTVAAQEQVAYDEAVIAGEEANQQAADDDLAGDGHYAPDDLDMADHIARTMSNADGLVQKSTLRKQKWSGLNDVAKFMRIQPASVLQSTTSGQAQVGIGDPPIQVVNWTGDDAETMPVTVTLAPVQQIENSPLTLQGQARPYGIVQFGTRGFLVKVEVDIGLGCQFTVSASAVTVQVAMDTPFANVGIPAIMKLAGMLSYMPIMRTAQVTRSKNIDVNGIGDSIIKVPPFSKNVTALTFNTKNVVPVSYRLLFMDSAGNVQYIRDIDLTTAESVLESIPISNDIVQIDVNNLTAAHLQGILVFGLGI